MKSVKQRRCNEDVRSRLTSHDESPLHHFHVQYVHVLERGVYFRIGPDNAVVDKSL